MPRGSAVSHAKARWHAAALCTDGGDESWRLVEGSESFRASQQPLRKSRPSHRHSGGLELHLTCVEQPFVAESATRVHREFLRLIEPNRSRTVEDLRSCSLDSDLIRLRQPGQQGLALPTRGRALRIRASFSLLESRAFRSTGFLSTAKSASPSVARLPFRLSSRREPRGVASVDQRCEARR